MTDEQKIKKEVCNKVLIAIAKAAKERGIAFRALLDEIPYDESYLLNQRERVEWWVFCKILTNMNKYFSPLDHQQVGEDFVMRGNFIEGIVGFFLLTTPKISRIFGGLILKRITSNFLCIKPKLEFVNSCKFRVTYSTDDEHEYSPELFEYGIKGNCHGLCKKAGFKVYEIIVQSIPHGAIYEISWKKESIIYNIKKKILWLSNLQKAFWELTDSNEALIKEYQELEDYKNNLELKVDERTAELQKAHNQLQEAKDLQNHFFTNISHEFRTPLTLILEPAKRILELSPNDEIKEEADLIYRNAKKLNRLANQLLDISRIESGKMSLKACYQNLIPVIKENVSLFHSFAESKNILLSFNPVQVEVFLYIDKNKIDKILTNILSNAIKFTRNGGSVNVNISLNDNCTEIAVSDTGIGIPKDQLNKIFDRFYQVDSSLSKEYEGTGIGLSLTKELVELHKGKIFVESEEGKGSVFRIVLLSGKDHLLRTEIFEENNNLDDTISRNFEKDGYFEYYQSNKNNIETKSIEKGNKSLILIVEDNYEVRKYISKPFNQHYKIIEAADGEEGLRKSFEKMPDLIISDIMMPKLDGIEFCRRIKANWETSHIPIILLTAKVSGKDKIEGLETGADDYLTKPFDSKELFIRVKNLLEQRIRLKEKFSREIKITSESITTNSLDNEFLNKVLKITKKNLANTKFDSEAFAKEMFVSRSQLHRKLIAITGLPTREFLRLFRLKKAAQLLLEKRLSISQIALEVGFSSHSHFTKAFHQQFGCLPSEFDSKGPIPLI